MTLSCFFPFFVKLSSVDSSIVVVQPSVGCDVRIPRNAKILSINDIDSKTIVTNIVNLSSGESISFRLARINQNSLFNVLLSALTGNTVFDIEYEYKGETFIVENVSGLKELSKADNKPNRSRRAYSLIIDSLSNTAIIHFNQFSDQDKFRTFANATFKLLKERNIDNLIIDIRDNGGGNSSIGDEFFSISRINRSHNLAVDQ